MEHEEKPKTTKEARKQVVRIYWQQYASQPLRSFITFILPPVGSVFVFFIPPLIVAEIVNTIAAEGTVPLSSLWKQVILFAGFWAVGEALWRTGQHFWIKLEEKAMFNLSKWSYKKLTDRDYDFFVNNFVGSLTSKTLGFVRGFEAVTDTIAYSITPNIIPLIFASVVLWRYSPWIPLMLLAWIAIGVSIAIPLIKRRSVMVDERHEASSKMTGRLSDFITNIFAVKSFAKEEVEEERYGEYVKTYMSKWKRAANYQNLNFFSVMSPLYVVTNVTGLIAAIFFTHQFGLQAGTLVVIFSYYQQITYIFWNISYVYRGLESAISESAEFTQMFLEPPKVQDVKSAEELNPRSNSINFQNVGFKYTSTDNKRELFLNGFNLKIEENQRVGLVGPSGGGKTTITKLLLRFLDVQSGRITIGDQDIRQVTQKSLREVVSYVPQEPLLFHRSLFENIAYGKDDATEEEVIKAAQLARADEFISVLPEGYQTLVGERGIKLSGGQRQRIAIARAILKNSPILVLDEATSSLDSESEKHIQEGLWELMKDKTALVIAHRLSTIKHLDRIIVLEGGKIVQDGTHDELIKTPGLYATLWSHQSGAFLADEPLENGRDHSGGSNYSDFRSEHST